MSDKKISQLTAATTADGTEPLPIVQSGETKKATGKVVVSGAVSDLAQTWNAAGTTFTGLKLNVTDTASASGSLLLDLQKGGTSQVALTKGGSFLIGTSATTTVGYTGAAAKLHVAGTSDAGISLLTAANNAVSPIISFLKSRGAIVNNGDNLGLINFEGEGGSGSSPAAYIFANVDGAPAAGKIPGRLSFHTTAVGATSPTERMRLDSSGNLGLGVTPSAWTIPAFQSSLGVFAGNTEFNTSANAYYDGAWKYIGTGVASRYSHAGAIHFWYTAISGTAGNTVTWSERFSASAFSFVINDPGNDYDFRIEGDTDANLVFVDASTDRIGIGTNAPSVKFQIYNNITGTPFAWGNATRTGYLYQDTGGVGISNLSGGVDEGIYLDSANNNVAIYVAGAEKMRLDSSGNLGLGTSTFGTSAAGVFAVKNGTAPTTGVADVLQIYSSDVSAGNTTLSIYTEGTPVSDSTDNAVTKKIAVRINGTLYYLLADTDNS